VFGSGHWEPFGKHCSSNDNQNWASFRVFGGECCYYSVRLAFDALVFAEYFHLETPVHSAEAVVKPSAGHYLIERNNFYGEQNNGQN
jgi:hypothetical protein